MTSRRQPDRSAERNPTPRGTNDQSSAPATALPSSEAPLPTDPVTGTAAFPSTPTTIDEEPVLPTDDTTPVPEDTDPPPQLGLPADGPATVGGVDLPAGRVLLGSDQRLAWITDETVPGTASVWKTLYDARSATGLYPVVLLDDGLERGWEAEVFFANQPFELDKLVLDEVMQHAADSYLDEPRPYDGLAPGSSGVADEAAADAAASGIPDGRILLVEAPRGGDALSFMGWTGNATYDTAEAIAVVIRSWEDRFGARVVAVGPTTVVLTIANPPATPDEAAALSKELVLIDPDLEQADTAPVTVVALGEALIGQHLWTLWWT